MVSVREFRASDVDALEPQDGQARTAEALADWRGHLRAAALHGQAWTALDGDRVLGVAGLGVHYPGRAEAWCMIGAGVPRTAWLAIHRAVLGVLAGAEFRRVEATSRVGFEAAHRWLHLLGFDAEGPLRAYGPDGADHIRWARVRR